MNGERHNPQEEAVRLPNAATLEAMRQVGERDEVSEYASLEELMAEFGWLDDA